MELTKSIVDSILKTLPIGYYAGRKIDVTLDDEAETSYYSMMTDKIVISYPILCERAKNVSENISAENAVRSMLYHEVSHAILTPTELSIDKPINVFEDERIETMLNNYYMDVNFRQQIIEINGGIHEAKDAWTAYYNAVRYGISTPRIQMMINSMLHQYDDLSRVSNYYRCIDYSRSIHRLYNEIANEFADYPEAFSPNSANSTDGSQDKEEQSNNSGNEMRDTQDVRTETDTGSEEDRGDDEEKEKEGEEEETARPSDLTLPPDKVKDLAKTVLNKKAALNPGERQKLDTFQKAAETIIGNFNKKNSGGSGINAYSGVFNPRAVARNDYRYFERAMSTQGNNKFGTCHLNLFIDCSGSYYYNQNITNGILASLSEIERKNKNFSLDVYFINDHFRKCKSVDDRVFTADGGNRIPYDIKKIMVNAQKPQTVNYNIVLFDGDAFSNQGDSMSAKRQLFKAFDAKQTTLITNSENCVYINDKFTATKVIVTDNYAAELAQHILNAFTIAFG
jgi:hypothetical protein